MVVQGFIVVRESRRTYPGIFSEAGWNVGNFLVKISCKTLIFTSQKP
jgi:hypothetical protein